MIFLRMLTLSLLANVLMVPLYGQEEQGTPESSEQKVREEVHEANVRDTKKQIIAEVSQLANSYKPALSEAAQELVNNSEAYAALVETVQNKFPHFSVGYIFSFEKAEDLQIKSSMVFSFSKEKNPDALATYSLDDVKGFLTSGMLSPVEVAILRDFIINWQKKSNEEVQRTIVDHPGLYQLVRDNDIQLSHYVKISSPQAEQPVEEPEAGTN